MGQIATEPQYRKVLSFLDSAVSEGATVAVGGQWRGASRWPCFVQPTVLTNVRPAMTVACEEVFAGPVLSIIPFDTEEEALRLANDFRYGLAETVWTKDIPPRPAAWRPHAMQSTAPCGSTPTGSSAPSVPFGGFGLSRPPGARTASTRSMSTPGVEPSGWSSPAGPATRSPSR